VIPFSDLSPSWPFGGLREELRSLEDLDRVIITHHDYGFGYESCVKLVDLIERIKIELRPRGCEEAMGKRTCCEKDEVVVE
jgi:hypothetical protein